MENFKFNLQLKKLANYKENKSIICTVTWTNGNNKMSDANGKGLFYTRLIDPNISHILPLGINENCIV